MEYLKDRLKKKGMRMTPQRLAVLEYIYESKTHPTVQDIYKHLKDRFGRLSLATVYNNVKALVDIGYVVELFYDNAAIRYDYNREENKYYHAICQKCGKIVNFELEELNRLSKVLKQKYNFHVENQKIQAFGLCHFCQDKVKEGDR